MQRLPSIKTLATITDKPAFVRKALMFIRGCYVVGCWGDIVERGNYE